MKNLICCSVVCLLVSISLHAQVQNKQFLFYKDLVAKKKKEMTRAIPPPRQLLKSGSEAWSEDSVLTSNWNIVSGSWNPFAKIIYGYDNQGLMNVETDFLWQEGKKQFTPDREYRGYFDENRNPLVVVTNIYDTITETWKPSERDSLEYENNLVFSHINYQYNPIQSTWFIGYYDVSNISEHSTEMYFLGWDSTYTIDFGIRMKSISNSKDRMLEMVVEQFDPIMETWVNDSKYVEEYLADTLLSSWTLYKWNLRTEVWEPADRISYSYTDNLLTKKIDLQWKNSAFQDIQQTIYEYNASKQNILELFQFRSNNAWFNGALTLTEYDSGGRTTKELHQIWNDPVWENNYQYLYTYSPVNQSSETRMQIFLDNQWVDSKLNTTIMDDNDKILESVNKYWNLETGLLEGISERYIYTYEGNSKETETYMSWDIAIPDWVNQSRKDTWYSIHPTVYVTEVAQVNVGVYPNPAGSTIYFDGLTGRSDISIFDQAGRLVLKQQIQGNSVDIGKLKSGVLYLTVETSEGIVQKKMVKQ